MPKKTQTFSATVGDPSWLSAPAKPSRLAIAYLNTWRVSHPHLISSHSYYWRRKMGGGRGGGGGEEEEEEEEEEEGKG